MRVDFKVRETPRSNRAERDNNGSKRVDFGLKRTDPKPM